MSAMDVGAVEASHDSEEPSDASDYDSRPRYRKVSLPGSRCRCARFPPLRTTVPQNPSSSLLLVQSVTTKSEAGTYPLLVLCCPQRYRLRIVYCSEFLPVTGRRSQRT